MGQQSISLPSLHYLDQGIRETIYGATPIYRVKNITNSTSASIDLKLERYNLSGSVKDRPAFHIISEAEKAGTLKPGATIIESSSGNFGISLAMIGAMRGYRVIILIDPKTTPTNRKIMEAFGAETIIVTEQDDSGSYHKTRIRLANELHKKIPNSFRPDQCFNKMNAEAHYKTTAPELLEQYNGRIDCLVLSVSTGGQAGGISKYFKEFSPTTRIVVVDAVGSAVFGGPQHGYLLPGMGLSWTPSNIEDLSLLDRIYKVPDLSAFLCCHVFARHEGLLLGASSGACIVAALKESLALKKGQNVVVIAPDGGDRYIDTIYDKDWLAARDMAFNVSIQELYTKVAELDVYSDMPNVCGNYQKGIARELLSQYAE